MKKLLLGIATTVASLSLMTPAANASTATATQEGPYGPVSFQDYGTCQNIWANLTESSTYYVQRQNLDGTYDVRLVLRGKFSSIAGQSPGACDTGTDNGNTIVNNVKGRLSITFHFVVSGGTFDPTATCGTPCATDYTYAGIQTFVTTFFGPTATYAFAGNATEVARSKNSALCLSRWTDVFDPTTGAQAAATGDIATTCTA